MNFTTDKKYIINLAKRTDRKAHILSEMEYFSFENYEIITAIDGDTLEHIQTPTKYLPNGLNRYQLACLRTHLQIIKNAKEQQLDYVTIIEDDCVFADDFIELYHDCIERLYSCWDMFYLGCNHAQPPTPISSNIAICKYALTTVCYVVRKSVYDLVIEALSKEDITIDMIYGEHIQPNVNALCAIPNLCSQLTGYSDIENKEVDYDKYYSQ